MAELREMTEDQLELFNKLDTFEQALAIALLMGIPPLPAFRMAAPTSTVKNSTARVRVSNTKIRPHFVAFMNAVQAELLSEALMSREEALEKLTVFARGNMTDLVDYRTVELGKDANGEAVEQSVWKFKDTDDIAEETMQCIFELKASPQGLSVKIHSAEHAIKQMSEMRGWNTPQKVDHMSRDGSMTPVPGDALDVSGLSTAALHEIIAARDASKADK